MNLNMVSLNFRGANQCSAGHLFSFGEARCLLRYQELRIHSPRNGSSLIWVVDEALDPDANKLTDNGYVKELQDDRDVHA